MLLLTLLALLVLPILVVAGLGTLLISDTAFRRPRDPEDLLIER